MPGSQRDIQDCVNKIPTAVGGPADAAGPAARNIGQSPAAEGTAADGNAAGSAQG
jgi:hypothetical protein